MDISIREATAADIDALAAGNQSMANETEGKTLDAETLRRGVAAVIEDPAKGHYWVAIEDAQVVGQIMISWEWSDWRNAMMWWIQSAHVVEKFRRRGVFSALYRYVENEARQNEECGGIRLYVEHNNERAQATYEALGMQHAGYRVMETDFTKG